MKTYISIGVVTNTLFFLRDATRLNCYSFNDLSNIAKKYANLETTKNFALQCGWIEIRDQCFVLTDGGRNTIECFDGIIISKFLWRSILNQYIIKSGPAWAHRIPAGRKEAFIFMSDEEKRCFMEAGLMDNPPRKDVVEWWDEISNYMRKEKNQKLNEIGRVGEELTVEYELSRTGAQPRWQSIETNLIGYDIISRIDKTSTEEILIEVKASTNDIAYAEMVVSRNEWIVANYPYNFNRYFFYLWCLNGEKKLAKVPASIISNHIPSESGEGTWNSISIPFASFHEYFKSV